MLMKPARREHISLFLLWSLVLNFLYATQAIPIAQDSLFLDVLSFRGMASPPYCPPLPSPASFICLILLQNLLFCKASSAIFRNSFVKPCPSFSVCYSGYANSSGQFVSGCSLFQRHASAQSSILPSFALPPCYICLILLWSLLRLLLYFPLLLYFSFLAAPATSVTPNCLLLNVHFVFLQLVEESLNEWRNEEVWVVWIVSRPLDEPALSPMPKAVGHEPHAKCSVCNTFLYIVAEPQFCIYQCLECFPQQRMHSRTLSRIYYSECIPLSALAAAAMIFWRCSNLCCAAHCAAECKQESQGLASKIWCLARKIINSCV